jgi:hypothetical protein
VCLRRIEKKNKQTKYSAQEINDNTQPSSNCVTNKIIFIKTTIQVVTFIIKGQIIKKIIIPYKSFNKKIDEVPSIMGSFAPFVID